MEIRNTSQYAAVNLLSYCQARHMSSTDNEWVSTHVCVVWVTGEQKKTKVKHLYGTESL